MPIDNALWGMAREAVVAAAARADEYIATGGWTPKVHLPSVGVFNSGWPNLSRSTLGGGDGPIDHSALFGPERGTLKPLAYDDVPALARFVAHARGRADLRARLLPEHIRDPVLADQMLAWEAADLPLSLLDRARAVGAT